MKMHLPTKMLVLVVAFGGLTLSIPVVAQGDDDVTDSVPYYDNSLTDGSSAPATTRQTSTVTDPATYAALTSSGTTGVAADEAAAQQQQYADNGTLFHLTVDGTVVHTTTDYESMFSMGTDLRSRGINATYTRSRGSN